MKCVRQFLAGLSLLTTACIHDANDFPDRLERALDAADVTLRDAMAIPARTDGDVVVAAELVLESVAIPLPPGGVIVTEDAVFIVDIWGDGGLTRTFVDLEGDVGPVEHYGHDDGAAHAAETVREAALTLSEATRRAQDIVDGARAFSAITTGARYEIEVVADERIYEIDISPADGDVLDVDLEGDWGHHDCPHWGC
jgi:hypothetical protein